MSTYEQLREGGALVCERVTSSAYSLITEHQLVDTTAGSGDAQMRF